MITTDDYEGYELSAEDEQAWQEYCERLDMDRWASEDCDGFWSGLR